MAKQIQKVDAIIGSNWVRYKQRRKQRRYDIIILLIKLSQLESLFKLQIKVKSW